MKNICIVSCFIKVYDKLVREDTFKINGSKLLDLSLNKIIFIDEDYYNLYIDNKYKNIENITWIFTKYEDLLYSNYTNSLERKISNYNVNLEKDTNSYFILMCNKTEFIEKAIKHDPDYNNYVWIDFGINYITKNNNTLKNIENFKIYDNIRTCVINKNKYFEEPYWTINWRFAGGILGGPKDKLLIFAALMRDVCNEYITKYNALLWEVNLWNVIENRYTDLNLFDTYYGNHNDSIINNY